MRTKYALPNLTILHKLLQEYELNTIPTIYTFNVICLQFGAKTKSQ